MPSKFEKLLDYLVNEEHDKATELFHEIVVEKSRTIYENLMTTEMDDLTAGDDLEEEEVLEFKEEGFDIGGDSADEFVDDVVDHSAMDTDAEMGLDTELDAGFDDGGASSDDIMDIKDAIEDLKAEFENLLSKVTDDSADDDLDFGDGEDDLEFNASDSEDDEELDAGNDDTELDAFGSEDEDEDEVIREYRELVKKINNGEPAGTNTKSPVNANPANRPSGGKVDANNIAQGNVEGKPKNAKVSGEKFASGIQNVDGKETDGYKGKAPAVQKKETNVHTKPIVPKS